MPPCSAARSRSGSPTRGELAGIRTELKKIGTNLNQAVRALNTYGSDPVVLNNLNRATSIVSTAVGWVNDLLARARE